MCLVECLFFDEKSEMAQIIVRPKEDDSEDFALAYFPKQVELMQSTGVKDVDGKEIFVGDIVEITYGKQVWDAIPAHCGSRKAKYDYRIDSLEDFFYTRKRNYIADSEFKVLGNIYENPELAKVVNKQ